MVRDRWDEEDELDRARARGRLSEPTLGEVIDGAVRKVVTSVVIAGGLIALGIYGAGSGGGDPSVDYQITSTPDGTIYRLDSDNGRIVACRQQQCWRMLYDRDEIGNAPPAQAAPSQQAPAQVAPTQPAPQLPAPTNEAAPAAR